MPSSMNDLFMFPFLKFATDEVCKALPIFLWPMLVDLLDVCLGAVSGDVVDFLVDEGFKFLIVSFSPMVFGLWHYLFGEQGDE